MLMTEVGGTDESNSPKRVSGVAIMALGVSGCERPFSALFSVLFTAVGSALNGDLLPQNRTDQARPIICLSLLNSREKGCFGATGGGDDQRTQRLAYLPSD